MELKQAVKILSYHNKWRKDNDGKYEQINADVIGKSIDVILDYLTDKI